MHNKDSGRRSAPPENGVDDEAGGPDEIGDGDGADDLGDHPEVDEVAVPTRRTARAALASDLDLTTDSSAPRFGPAREFLVWTLVIAAVLVAARLVTEFPSLGLLDFGVILMTLWFCLHLLLSAYSRPWVTTRGQDQWLGRQRVAVVLAHYNEDPLLLAKCLESISMQTRQPDIVWVIDDGSSDRTSHDAALEWAASQSFETEVHRVEDNVGKRHAQRLAFSAETADIFVTVDSDSVLDPEGISEGLKPFADPEVHAVSGAIVGLNWRRNLLTRVLDIEFVNSFVVGRAAMNRFRCMTVTCGVLAFYRGWVIRKYLDAYVNQRFLGSVVRAGDDRDLTQYAMLEGRTVHQESAVAYTALPERVSHLFRQRFRWGSSLYRGVVWAYVHLPYGHPGYWVLSFQMIIVVCSSVVWGWLLLWEPIVNGSFHLLDITYLLVLSCLRSLRYLGSIRRNQTTRERWSNLLLSPLVAVLYALVLSPVLFLSIFGVQERRWWTRSNVEVKLRDSDLPADAVDAAREQSALSTA